MDQWNRIESPEINPCLYGQLILHKGARSENGVKIDSTNVAGRSGQPHEKKKKKRKEKKKEKLDHQLTLYIRTNSRWIKDFNISRDTIKVLEENMGSKMSDIPHSNIYINISPRAKDIKERINI